MSEEQEYPSDFGKGFAYCLGLFVMHWERVAYARGGESRLSSWFYCAGDHLAEIETDPAILGEEIATKVKELTSVCDEFRDLGHRDATMDDVRGSVKKALEILRMWDERQGIAVEKARWE